MSDHQYPALWNFLGGYLHQDWRLDHATPSDALRDFAQGSPQLARQLPDEIDRVLTLDLEDEALDELMHQLGSFYSPRGDGEEAHQWLRNIRDLARLITGP